MLASEFVEALSERVKDLEAVPYSQLVELYYGFNAIYSKSDYQKELIYDAAAAAVKKLVKAKKKIATALIESFHDTNRYAVDYLVEVVEKMTDGFSKHGAAHYMDDNGIIYIIREDDVVFENFEPVSYRVRIAYLSRDYGSYTIRVR